MPIRFACPHCHQKLSVSSRKAGTSADCPRCKKKLSIPTPPPEVKLPAAPVVVAEQQEDRGQRTEDSSRKSAAETFDAARLAEKLAESETAVAVAEPPQQPEPAPEAENAVWTPDPAGYEGMELVYDTAEASTVSQPAFAEHTELVAIPRYVLYLQGGLLGVVALVAFTIGMLAGGAILTQPPAPAAAQACVIRGSVTYASGPRQLPDEGAVIAVLPQSQAKPDERAPVAGLRPEDPTPGDTNRGIAVLRDLGGAYTRTDANGRFELQVPNRGRYLVLVVSNRSLLRSVEQIQTGDILKIAPYFDDAADLLGNHRYQLTPESFQGDQDFPVVFE
jgi:hypothetical protein